MKRYSKKRQAILDCLMSTKSHPTAEWVYLQLRSAYPNLSLATVYRNLNQLKEAGLIRSVGTVLGQERFDATVEPHPHAICSRCGRTVDVSDISVPNDVLLQVSKETGFFVTASHIQFTGLCRSCLEEQKETKEEK